MRSSCCSYSLRIILIIACFHFASGFRLDQPSYSSRSSPFPSRSGVYSAGGDQCIDTLVVGGGLSGSTAAFYLQQRGIDCRLAEANSQLGGNIISKSENGFKWEEGPNSFQPTNEILKLAKDLDMLEDLVLSDPSDPRYIYYDNKLQALPMSVQELITSNLLSCAGKGKAVAGAMGFVSPKPKDKEESIKEFACRHLGQEVFERVVDPFVSGIYAGDPDSLSMKAALGKIQVLEDSGLTSSLVEGAIASFLKNRASTSDEKDAPNGLPKVPSGSLGTFKNGMGSVLKKIQRYLGPTTVKQSHELVNLQKDGADWVSSFDTPTGEKTFRSKSVLLSMPAYAAAKVLSKARDGSAGVVPEAEILNSIRYPGVVSVTLAYPSNAFKRELKGFGHLIPRSMHLRTLGTIWTSSLFPGQAPDGYSTVRSFIGGASDPEAVKLSPDELVKQVHKDLKRTILKDYAPDPAVLGVKKWEKAIPQYERGHGDIIETVDRAIAVNAPGLFLGGNFKGGVSLGDCIKNGGIMADKIGGYLMQGK